MKQPKILVTGGTGTIGRVICLELLSRGYLPIVYSRDTGRQLEHCPTAGHEVGDIEDEAGLRRVCRRDRYVGVIHAAANKHVALCENRPSIAVKANLLGSLNVLKVCRDFEIPKAVFISTDKASNHTQIYGSTKWMMEQMVAEYAEDGVNAVNVRFGNVFGSTGSVIPIWNKAATRGDSISLRCNQEGKTPLRYGMLPSEAANFCIDTLFSESTWGATLVRKMKVVDIGILALIYRNRYNIELNFSPLNKGEVLAENLLNEREEALATEKAEYYEINWRAEPGIKIGSIQATSENAMNYSETEEFLNKVLMEMV